MRVIDNDMIGINLSENSSAIHEALRKQRQKQVADQAKLTRMKNKDEV
jgi:hypothetical protein